MEDFQFEDRLLIPSAKMAIRSQVISKEELQINFQIGPSRAERLLKILEELKILNKVNEEYKSTIKDNYQLSRLFKAKQNDIDSFLNTLESSIPNEVNEHEHGLDFGFDYDFKHPGIPEFNCSILAYYVLGKAYRHTKPHLNVMIHMFENGAEHNPLIDFSGEGYSLIEYLLMIVESKLYPDKLEMRKSAFKVLEQYLFACESKGIQDIDKNKNRLYKHAKI